jgi:hypothetical protein
MPSLSSDRVNELKFVLTKQDELFIGDESSTHMSICGRLSRSDVAAAGKLVRSGDDGVTLSGYSFAYSLSFTQEQAARILRQITTSFDELIDAVNASDYRILKMKLAA